MFMGIIGPMTNNGLEAKPEPQGTLSHERQYMINHAALRRVSLLALVKSRLCWALLKSDVLS